ncbi:MAG: hypothetical protein WC254_01005 [Candidatus Woesearchaeota archaeon]|jgi:hypothetical protein
MILNQLARQLCTDNFPYGYILHDIIQHELIKNPNLIITPDGKVKPCPIPGLQKILDNLDSIIPRIRNETDIRPLQEYLAKYRPTTETEAMYQPTAGFWLDQFVREKENPQLAHVHMSRLLSILARKAYTLEEGSHFFQFYLHEKGTEDEMFLEQAQRAAQEDSSVVSCYCSWKPSDRIGSSTELECSFYRQLNIKLFHRNEQSVDHYCSVHPASTSRQINWHTLPRITAKKLEEVLELTTVGSSYKHIYVGVISEGKFNPLNVSEPIIGPKKDDEDTVYKSTVSLEGNDCVFIGTPQLCALWTLNKGLAYLP